MTCPLTKTRDMSPFPSARWWRRLERRARAAFDGDQLDTLRRLGSDASAVTAIAFDADSLASLLRVRLGDHVVILAGIDPRARELLHQAFHSSATVRFEDAGRYGRVWWISYSDERETNVITASRVRCSFDGEGWPAVGRAFPDPVRLSV
jgi:hypothetical protein